MTAQGMVVEAEHPEPNTTMPKRNKSASTLSEDNFLSY